MKSPAEIEHEDRLSILELYTRSLFMFRRDPFVAMDDRLTSTFNARLVQGFFAQLDDALDKLDLLLSDYAEDFSLVRLALLYPGELDPNQLGFVDMAFSNFLKGTFKKHASFIELRRRSDIKQENDDFPASLPADLRGALHAYRLDMTEEEWPPVCLREGIDPETVEETVGAIGRFVSLYCDTLDTQNVLVSRIIRNWSDEMLNEIRRCEKPCEGPMTIPYYKALPKDLPIIVIH